MSRDFSPIAGPLLCVTTQVTREGNASRAEGPVRGISLECLQLGRAFER